MNQTRNKMQDKGQKNEQLKKMHKREERPQRKIVKPSKFREDEMNQTRKKMQDKVQKKKMTQKKMLNREKRPHSSHGKIKEEPKPSKTMKISSDEDRKEDIKPSWLK